MDSQEKTRFIYILNLFITIEIIKNPKKTRLMEKLIDVLYMESPVTKSDINLQKMREVKRLKSVEDKRVGSEVFDRITLKTLYKLANQGYIHLLNGAISTGK